MLKKVTIYGERCSGTNYLEELLCSNFDIEIVWSYGWKHFFGFNELSNTDDVLFIGIIRNIDDWINSLYRNPHHLPSNLINDENTFLNSEFYSLHDNGDESYTDRNIETGKRYKNIFELRHTKNKFLVDTMPLLVKNYCLITYDNLIDNFVDVMNQLKNYNLQVKSDIEFPLNISYYKKNKDISFKKIPSIISSTIITEKANLFYEKILFPKKYIKY